IFFFNKETAYKIFTGLEFRRVLFRSRQVTFKFEQNDVFAKYGPAYSINNDANWKWYGENRVVNNCFTFSFSPRDTIAGFSVAFRSEERRGGKQWRQSI